VSEHAQPVVWEGRDAAAWQSEWRVPALHLFDITTSTNDVAARLADAGAAPGTTVIADEQTAGRGQAGRAWTASPGQSVLLSIVLHADSGTDPGTAPLRFGVAAAIAIERVTGLEIRIKWPNDLLLQDGRKVAGLLCEATSGSAGTRIVAGIGINVHQRPDDFPPGLREHAGSLRMAGSNAARPVIVKEIVEQLRPFRVLPPPLDARTLHALAARDALRGHTVEVDGIAVGVALGIAADGSLIVRAGTRALHVRSGSVRRVTAAGAGTAHATRPPGTGTQTTTRAETPR
jgi:BirA family biotin operon repressor/biotin-[acetyl-CoA-carboxylase] ligase